MSSGVVDEEVGRCQDVYGDKIVVGQLAGGVYVQFFSSDGEHYTGMWFEAGQRDAFIKLWAEAERRAEAEIARRDEAGQAVSGG